VPSGSEQVSPIIFLRTPACKEPESGDREPLAPFA
jgi:hypothetical protein